jgi:hypothetical protein
MATGVAGVTSGRGIRLIHQRGAAGVGQCAGGPADRSRAAWGGRHVEVPLPGRCRRWCLRETDLKAGPVCDCHSRQGHPSHPGRSFFESALINSPLDLADAIAEVSRYRSSPFLADPALQELRLWMMRPPFCRLRSLPPVRPAKPVSDEEHGGRRTPAPVASAAFMAPSGAVEDADGSARGVTMQLDIRFLAWPLVVAASS